LNFLNFSTFQLLFLFLITRLTFGLFDITLSTTLLQHCLYTGWIGGHFDSRRFGGRSMWMSESREWRASMREVRVCPIPGILYWHEDWTTHLSAYIFCLFFFIIVVQSGWWSGLPPRMSGVVPKGEHNDTTGRQPDWRWSKFSSLLGAAGSCWISFRWECVTDCFD
jgi:hypothetical protein